MNLKFTQMLIQKHEGYRMTAYKDTRGNWTIGVGFNLSDPSAQATCDKFGLSLNALLDGAPLSYETSSAIMDYKIEQSIPEATKLIPAFNSLPDDAQAVVIDMIYNMGAAVFSEFKETIAAINAGNYELASEEMARSPWFGEVGSRGVEDCSLMFSAGG